MEGLKEIVAEKKDNQELSVMVGFDDRCLLAFVGAAQANPKACNKVIKPTCWCQHTQAMFLAAIGEAADRYR